jgi:hypothetical protein
MKFKQPPIREVQSAKRWSYDASLFSADSPYFEALRSAELFVSKRRPTLSKADWTKLRTLLVHECEMAKEWQLLWINGDDPQRAMASSFNSASASLDEVEKIVEMLQKKDNRHGSDLRNIFYHCAQIAISPAEESSAIMPDPNLPDGGFEVPNGGRVARAVEIQLLARLFLGQFDQWLNALKLEIVAVQGDFRIGARIGPMFLTPPLPDSSIVKRSSTQLATLALVGRLRKALTLAVDPHRTTMPKYDTIGGGMPDKPVAAWEVLHQFIIATFSLQPEELDLNALKQRWSSATKQRKIRFSSWPDPIQRQANQK